MRIVESELRPDCRRTPTKVALILLYFTLLWLQPHGVRAQESTPGSVSTPGSRILTVENKVALLVKNSTDWRVANPGQRMHPGDKLRTERSSRATLRMADLSVLRINELTTFEIIPPQEKDRKPLINLKSGSLYFFSREKPADVHFRTPTVAGAIRGTEFVLSVGEDGETRVSLLDGAVDLGNEAGQIELKSGEQARVVNGQAPTKSPLLDAVNVIQWCLYYPAVVDAEEISFTEPEKETLRESLGAYRAGDLLAALGAYSAANPQPTDATRVYHAALLLSVGRVDEANQLLAGLPESSSASRALRQLLAAVQFKEWTCGAPPATASEWLAESYYLQSRARLDDALQSARRAAARSPKFGFASVRVAELEFSFARVTAAESALDIGLQHSPRHAQGFALRGFIAAARDRQPEALKWFDQAIERDGALGNAWLGRGLVRIRQGERKEGRQDLQTAAALEPNRALIRNYLGKAFSHEGRDALAQKDLRLARKLDPNDPTAWLYSALLNQQHNRINEAIRELEKSQDLNDNQAIFRSKLLLDQDRAVRSANLASIFRDAGMGDVSVREAAKAVNTDYANYSAHLFLASSYDLIRDPKLFNLRYEAPARSEWLIGNLLAPVGAGTLSRNMSQQDYVRLFEQDGFGISSSTEYRSHGEWIQSGSQYGRFGRMSYALDAYYRSDNGQRPNNDLEHLQISAQVKYQITPQDSVFLTAEYFNQESGDVAQHYDPATANTGLRVKETQEPNLFVGYHREWSPGSHTLFLAGRIQDSLTLVNPDAQPLFMRIFTNGAITRVRREPFYKLDYQRDFTVYSAELQHILDWHPHTIIVGGGYQNGRADIDAQLNVLGTTMSSQKLDLELERLTAYGYYQWRIIEPLAVTAGVTYDRLTYPRNALNAPLSANEVTEDQVSPKAGLIYTPWKRTTLRALYSQALGGLFNENSFRLEPTQIAGLNQSVRSAIPESAAGLLPGAHLESYAVSLDQSFETGTFLGVMGELLQSDGERTVGAFTNNIASAVPNRHGGTRQTLDYHEKSLLLTANQLIGQEWSVGLRYRISLADLQSNYPDVPAGVIWQVAEPRQADQSALLQQLTLHLAFNHSSGFFAQFQSHWTEQNNRGDLSALSGDSFWQHDVVAGWRFAKRRAELRVGVLNLTDQNYQLHPLNLSAERPRQRSFFAGAKFNF